MELYKEILAHALMYGEVKTELQNQEMEVSQIVEGTCYKALEKIKAIIEDDNLEDKECFMKIEEMVCALEQIGSSGGNRHDFG